MLHDDITQDQIAELLDLLSDILENDDLNGEQEQAVYAAIVALSRLQ